MFLLSCCILKFVLNNGEYSVSPRNTDKALAAAGERKRNKDKKRKRCAVYSRVKCPVFEPLCAQVELDPDALEHRARRFSLVDLFAMKLS